MTGLMAAGAAPARAVDVKLWPLVDYHHDTRATSLHLLGPLVAYEHDAQHLTLSLRPLLSYTRAAASGNQLALLYPVFVSRWDAQRTDYRMLGLISYHTEPAAPPRQWSKRFTIFPLVFYRHSRTRGTSLSVLPFYADVPDLLGYRRIRMILFPLYLRLEKPLVQRTWLPFPFVSWTGGTLGRGYRIWPLYGWERDGDAERFTYVLWPLYVSQERHFTRPADREQRLLVFPFYMRSTGPHLDSRSFVGPFFTHTIDRTRHTDTWGFPWPLWLSQRDLRTGARTSLRVAPFYEDSHFGDLHAHFILWPLYRWHTQESDTYRHRRSDALLVLYRNVRDEQPAYHHVRTLHTLFPLYRASSTDGAGSFSTLAVLDALLPRNPIIAELYAPLWQLYTRHTVGEGSRWSLLWDLVSSDGTTIRYPVYLDLDK